MSNLPIPSKGSRTPASLSPLQLYLQEIARYPLLDPEEEYDLAVKHFEDGDVNAAHRLITSNLRLVVKIANDFRQVQGSVLDLIQEGNYGLMQAVKRFNPYKGVRLSSYSAWWIRAYILKLIMDSKSQVKIGTTAAQRKLFFNLKKEAEKLLAEYDRVDPKMLADRLHVREKDVVEMQQRLSGPDMSLDAPLGSEDGTGNGASRVSQMASPQISIEDDLAGIQELRIFEEHLDEFQATLKGRDLEVFNLRMRAEDPITLQEIGNKYGITRERARQIEAKIMKNLRLFVEERGTIDISSK